MSDFPSFEMLNYTYGLKNDGFNRSRNLKECLPYTFIVIFFICSLSSNFHLFPPYNFQLTRVNA